MMKKVLSTVLCVCLAFALLPTAALAAGDGKKTELDISKAPIVFDESTVTGNGGSVSPDPDGYIITGTSDSFTIKVTGGTHDITLSGVDITPKDFDTAAFSISGVARVNLTLEEDNVLTGAAGKAGLEVPSGATLTINGSGSLTATGGEGYVKGLGGKLVTWGGGAGIGGNGGGEGGNGGNGGTVTIEGGTVTAIGGNAHSFYQNGGGAGIGGGGSVNATGGNGGAVTIKGGTVNISATTHAIYATKLTLGKYVLIKNPAGGVKGSSKSGDYVFETILDKVDGIPVNNVIFGYPTVDSVTVASTTASIQKGNSQQFTATVTGVDDPAQTVTWSVEGGSTGTSIDENGKLTVAATETATMLTVKAISAVDTTKYGTATVTVTPPPAVTSVTVSPESASVVKGSSKTFTAIVTGENSPATTVSWSVEDASSASTAINEEGVLTVAADETATTLTVKATSTVDTKKSGTVTVTVTTPPDPDPAPAPAPSYIPDYNDDPRPVTVYNDTANHRATVGLSGVGLNSSDQLITESDPKGAIYVELRGVAGRNEVVGTFEISLKSGKKGSGAAMQLSFRLGAVQAGQDFTLVHRKADGTYEYFYTTSDANGNLSFGPLYELSPFLLVKGTLEKAVLPEVPDVTIDEVPKTGDAAQTAALAGMLLIGLLGLGAVYIAKRKRV